MLLVHGSGPGVSAWANWRSTIAALAPSFRVIAPDIVGFGYTERPSGFRYDLAAWTAHLVGVLDALDLPEVSLIGNSFGGALALSLAAGHPDRLGKVVLMGTVGVAGPISPGLEQVWATEPNPEQMREVMQLFAFDRSLLTDELIELRTAAAARPEAAQAWRAMFPAPRQERLDALAQPDIVLSELPQDFLLVHGRDDRVIPFASSVRLSELLSRNDLHVFGRCGHWVQIEAADRFARLVTDFLSH